MTEERIRPESGGDKDSLVTRTYKDVASELAPGHLNRAVMKQAADAARPRYLKSVSWTRPMAWAATITLCVALVLEVTNSPAPEITDILSPAGRVDAPASELAPAPEVNEPELNEPWTPAIKAETPTMRESLAPVERKRVAKMSKNLRQQAAAKPASAEEPSMKDDDMLRPAKEIATLQVGDNAESDLAESGQALGTATFVADSPDPAPPACSETEVAAADSWALCIKKLEDAGRMTEANEQRALYDAAYPADEPL